MPILREAISWRRARPQRTAALTVAEQAGVRRAIEVLRIRFGSLARAARQIGCSRSTLNNAVRARAPSPAVAVGVARALGVPVSVVLAGKFPKPGQCAMCGRVTLSANNARIEHA